ncbi:MAG: hypothetical protein Q8K92_13615 [Leadbetterella sp.]|nr:hypothetical protein [Leadbetterella sp.]
MGTWLKQLNGKTVDKVYQVDFNRDRHADIYLPWLFFITFTDLDKFLEIEGDFDGDHIKITLKDITELDQKLKDNDFPNEPDLWSVYASKSQEPIGKLLGQKIMFVEYGIDKDEFEINDTLIMGQKGVFAFISINCLNLKLTIFEGLATGLDVSDDPDVKLSFEETFDRFNTI